MGGILVNVVTGILIFIVLNYYNGESYLKKADLNVHGIVAYELGQEIGFQDGDKVIKVNGQDYETFSDLVDTEVLFNKSSYYTVQRENETVDIRFPDGFLDKISDKKKYDGKFIGIRQPFKVDQVIAGSAASDGGLEEGDQFLTANGQNAFYFHDFQRILKEYSGQEINTQVLRGSENIDLSFTVEENGTLGFRRTNELNWSHKDYTFGESVNKGSGDAFKIVWTTIQGFGKIFRGEVSASNSIAGPVGIAQMFGGTWDWLKFWSMTGLLSMVLAFMNFLPIPALDGGHVVFLTYEMVSGQKPSDKFLENAQKVGMVMLLGIMGFAIFNDIYKVLF